MFSYFLLSSKNELISLLNLQRNQFCSKICNIRGWILLKFWNTLRYKTNIGSRSLFIIQYPNELELFYNKKGAHMNAPGTDWSDWGTQQSPPVTRFSPLDYFYNILETQKSKSLFSYHFERWERARARYRRGSNPFLVTKTW